MKHADFQKIRSYLTAAEAVLARSGSGHADEESLLEFRRLCWAALLLSDDAECHAQIDLLVQCAKDLYSGREHESVEQLKGKISDAFGSFRARLNSLESGYGKRWRDLRAA